MKYKVAAFIHICILILALILLFCTKMGPDYFHYIYAISIGKNPWDFNTFIFAEICALIMFVVDIICIIKGTAAIIRTRNKILLKRIIYWLVMACMAALSIHVILMYYIIWIT